jgi:FdhD protein
LNPTNAAIHTVPVLRHQGAQQAWAQDQVICERPVAMVFNGVSHAVMMATPTDLDDFALGFALSEGLIEQAHDCQGIEVIDTAHGIELHMQIPTRLMAALQARRRALNGRTGCGLCGIDSLQALAHSHPPALPRPPAESPMHRQPHEQAQAVLHAFAQLGAQQALQADTGGCHAAAWASHDGTLRTVREDVGRHNALDKLIGQRARHGHTQQAGFALVSSRASYELVSKCARTGIGTLAAISAPTSMAIELALRCGVQLYGFCRGQTAVNYTAQPPHQASRANTDW